MTKIHLLCSTNWPPSSQNIDQRRILAPFSTIVDHITNKGIALEKLILLGGNQPTDFEYCRLVSNELKSRSLNVTLQVQGEPGDWPAEISRAVSSAATLATAENAELWVDLTPGPKHRSAALFAAASAVPNVHIVYSEYKKNGYEITPFQHLGSYNTWLGQHGVWIRNYREELSGLSQQAQVGTGASDKPIRKEEVMTAISSMLAEHPGLELSSLKPDSNLFSLVEWVYRNAVPEVLFKVAGHQWISAADNYVRKRETYSAQVRSAGRASQLLWIIRSIFAHEASAPAADTFALLDCLSFLASRLNVKPDTRSIVQTSEEESMFIAIDGDDVGRRFEERLAQCLDATNVQSLRDWSHRIQQELSQHMIALRDRWKAGFLARTGDGFLASFPAKHFDDLSSSFQPQLTDGTVTVGIGITVKDAYLALKIGKAKNRGGGIYYSFNPPEEKILWKAPILEYGMD